MSERTPFQYAVIRIVPDPARAEFVNVGIILYAPDERFLQARIALDAARVRALDPRADLTHITNHLEAIPRVCQGAPEAGGLSELSLAERFRWLTSPRNTVIQTSPVHTGLADDPAATLDQLLETLVRAPIGT